MKKFLFTFGLCLSSMGFSNFDEELEIEKPEQEISVTIEYSTRLYGEGTPEQWKFLRKASNETFVRHMAAVSKEIPVDVTCKNDGQKEPICKVTFEKQHSGGGGGGVGGSSPFGPSVHIDVNAQGSGLFKYTVEGPCSIVPALIAQIRQGH